MFFRLLSGFQSSITAHIFNNFYACGRPARHSLASNRVYSLYSQAARWNMEAQRASAYGVRLWVLSSCAI